MTKLPVRDIDREGMSQNINTTGFWDTLGDFFSGISIQFGVTQPPPPPVPETKEEDKTLTYVVIGFGVIIVLLLLFRK